MGICLDAIGNKAGSQLNIEIYGDINGADANANLSSSFQMDNPIKINPNGIPYGNISAENFNSTPNGKRHPKTNEMNKPIPTGMKNLIVSIF